MHACMQAAAHTLTAHYAFPLCILQHDTLSYLVFDDALKYGFLDAVRLGCNVRRAHGVHRPAKGTTTTHTLTPVAAS